MPSKTSIISLLIRVTEACNVLQFMTSSSLHPAYYPCVVNSSGLYVQQLGLLFRCPRFQNPKIRPRLVICCWWCLLFPPFRNIENSFFFSNVCHCAVSGPGYLCTSCVHPRVTFAVNAEKDLRIFSGVFFLMLFLSLSRLWQAGAGAKLLWSAMRVDIEKSSNEVCDRLQRQWE